MPNNPLRRLGPMELWSSSRHSLGIYRAVTVSARYVPSSRAPSVPITSVSPRLLAALAVVVRAHPMLRVGITSEDINTARYTHIPSMDLREHVSVVAVADDALNEEAARVQAAQHDALWEKTESKAPWRLTIVRDEQRDCEDIIFAFHHALLDGASGRIFHEHLLAALNATLPEDDHILSFPDPPALPEPQEEAVGFTISPLYVASMLWREFAPAMLKPAAPSIWGARDISFSRPYVTRIRPVDFSESRTRMLLAACRANKTTLTALLHALVFAYFAKALPDDVPGLTAVTPVGLRRYIRDDVDASLRDTLRVLICSIDHVFSAADVSAMRAALSNTVTAAIWSTARRVRSELAACATHNNVAGMMHHVSDWRGLHTARDGIARASSWECSNVGALTAAAGDKVRVSRLLFSNGAMVTGAAVGVNVASAGGMSIALSWQEGVVEDALVEGLGLALEGMVNRFYDGGEWKL